MQIRGFPGPHNFIYLTLTFSAGFERVKSLNKCFVVGLKGWSSWESSGPELICAVSIQNASLSLVRLWLRKSLHQQIPLDCLYMFLTECILILFLFKFFETSQKHQSSIYQRLRVLLKSVRGGPTNRYVVAIRHTAFNKECKLVFDMKHLNMGW